MIRVYYHKLALDGAEISSHVKNARDYVMESQRFAVLEDRNRFLVGRLMLNAVLSTDCLSHVRYNKYGKPYVENQSQFHFNLSHSHGLVVLATASFDVGIDIEHIVPIDLRHYNNVLTANELKSIADTGNSTREFYRLWTRKEALLKAQGTGLCERMNLIDTTLAVVDFKGKSYHWSEIVLSDHYICHLASERPIETIELKEILLSEML